MEFLELGKRVWRAIDMLHACDSTLFCRDASEWSIAHRLAVYLEHELPGWNVDCEYNRQGPDGDVKKTPDANGKERNTRPDIVVHHRGRLELPHNLLVIEVKKKNTDPDLKRACDFTAQPNGERNFQYQYGLALSVIGGPKLNWFTKGSPLACRSLDRT